MEWIIYLMIALMAFAPSLGLPVLINTEDACEPINAIGSSSGGSVFPYSDPLDLYGPGGGTGPDSTEA